MVKNGIRITSHEYSSSNQRIANLQQIIEDGVDAESVSKFADRLVDEIGKETLECIAHGDPQNSDCLMTYRVAVRFSEMVKGIVSRGKQKESSLRDINK